MISFCIAVSSVGISSKLDFGSDDAHPGTLTIKKEGESQYRIVDEKKSNFDGIGVVCVSGICNKTDSNAGGVSTDVLVHVKTNVNISGNNSSSKEEVPDVPVVVGYGSSGVHSIVNEGNYNPPPPTYSSTFEYNTPEVNSRPEFVPLQPEIITIPSSSFRPSRPAYRSKTDPRNYKNAGFQPNNVQVQIPHRPYFINHYFGEHPPPQLVWYPSGRSSYNPLEFKRTSRPNPNWSDIRSFTTNQIPNPTGTTCTCLNDGPNYYPTTQHYHVQKRTTAIQVDDKLAPLN